MEAYLAYGVAWLAIAGLSAWVAAQKSRPAAEGFILGILFGPLGAIVEGLLPAIVEADVAEAEERRRERLRLANREDSDREQYPSG